MTDLTHAQITQIKLARARGKQPREIAALLGIEPEKVLAAMCRSNPRTRFCSVSHLDPNAPSWEPMPPRYRGRMARSRAMALARG